MKFKKIFSIIILLLIVLAVLPVQAEYEIKVTIPHGTGGDKPDLLSYIHDFYLFGVFLVAIAALISLIIGGFMYMFSDTVTTKDRAKSYIWGALSGLILALAAYLILYTINPNLVELKLPSL